MEKVKRLFAQFQPERYKLYLAPDKKSKTFSGSVVITGRLTTTQNYITLHALDLAIHSAAIKQGSKDIPVKGVEFRKDADEILLHSDRKLSANKKYDITVEFAGKITEPMHGIYPCNFKLNGKSRQLLATQFESHHAREVFPCIDEPEGKATFELTLKVPKNEVALSNTPEAKSKAKDGFKEVTFEETPVMSPYLLAFVVGKIEPRETVTASGVSIRIWTTPDNIEHTQFALDVASKTLDYYNDYFSIPYPLPKCDLVALPDFSSGAMENWGLITFREAALLVDYKNTSIATKQHVAVVIAHELAHQWFGNLVTMRWWDDLWLNEGFASWIEYLAVDHLFPKWNMWTQFLTDDYLPARMLDALENSHPIQIEVKNPNEIRSIFDAISYSKGASVIRMLHSYLGADNFRKGLIYYLKTYRYGNAATRDLWQALEYVSKKPVDKFMSAWTSQTGFPVLNVEAKNATVSFFQERYLINPKTKKTIKNNIVWPISINATHTNETYELTQKSGSWRTKGATFAKFNYGQNWFYITAYEDDHLLNLAKMVEDGRLGAEDRLGLLSDSFELTKAGIGKTSTDEALHLLAHYANEDNAAVWDVISSQIGSIRRVMDADEITDAFRPYVANLARRQYERLGWEEGRTDSHFDKLLRPTVLGLMCFAKDKDALAKALVMFTSMKQPEDIHPDIRSVVYTAAARNGDDKTHNKLLGLYKKTASAEERVNLASALTGFYQLDLVHKSLALINSNHVKLQDVPYWLMYSFANRKGKGAAWSWLKDNWGFILKNFERDMFMPSIPRLAGHAFSDEAKIKELRDFFTSVKAPGTERTIKQAVETIEWQSEWKKRDYQKVLKFLKSFIK